MGYGVNRKESFFYKNAPAILFVVSVLCVISIDTVTRYFSLLHADALQDSSIYSFLRSVLFVFLIGVSLFDKKRIDSKELNFLYLFCLISTVSFFINFVDFLHFFKSFVFTFSFIFIYRYGLLLGRLNKNAYPIIVSIAVLVTILLIQYISTYLFSSSNIAVISNDAIFSLVVFMPFVFLIRDKKMMILLLFFILMCTLFSQKRSAILFVYISASAAIFFYFIKSVNFKFVFAVISMILISLRFLEEIKKISFVESALNRFESAEDNGRAAIIDATLNGFNNADFINILFGHGYNATIRNIGLPSHNDFVEVLYNYGIFAMSLYVLIFIIMGTRCIVWFRSRHRFLEYYVCYIIAFILLVGFSLFNNMVFSTYNIVLFLALGFSSSNIKNEIIHKL